MAYDGQGYREQMLKENKEKQKNCYPVVTMVLYFGMKRWKKPKSVYDCIEVTQGLKPYVSDYKINVFEIAYLESEIVEKFTSDFRIVAD